MISKFQRILFVLAKTHVSCCVLCLGVALHTHKLTRELFTPNSGTTPGMYCSIT